MNYTVFNWQGALQIMRQGFAVQRKSQQFARQCQTNDGTPYVLTGEEPIELAHAWTDEEKAVRVFRGADTGVLFVPEAHHLEAEDWVIT